MCGRAQAERHKSPLTGLQPVLRRLSQKQRLDARLKVPTVVCVSFIQVEEGSFQWDAAVDPNPLSGARQSASRRCLGLTCLLLAKGVREALRHRRQ
jgi:hypothetical protein